MLRLVTPVLFALLAFGALAVAVIESEDRAAAGAAFVRALAGG